MIPTLFLITKNFLKIIDIIYIYCIYCLYKVYTVYTQYTVIGGDMLKILISNSSKEPIYEQISNQVKNLILSGSLEEGYSLPSIRSLASDLKISVITTKRAYEELEKEGFIETLPGKGSFVAAQNKELLRERKMQIVEGHLIQAINEAKSLNLSLNELKELLDLLY